MRHTMMYPLMVVLAVIFSLINHDYCTTKNNNSQSISVIYTSSQKDKNNNNKINKINK